MAWNLFNGSGSPGTLSGQASNDNYIDVITGDLYQLQSGTWTKLGTLPIGSWIKTTETVTRESATSFSEPINATEKYGIGDPIKWVDSGGTKYGNVSAVGAYTGGKTIMSLAPNSDFSMASGSITSLYFSKSANPQGFPHWFNWTPTITAGTGTPTTISVTKAGFNLTGRVVNLYLDISITNKGTASGALNATLPISTASSSSGGFFGIELSAVGYGISGFNTTTTLAIYFYNGTTVWGNSYDLSVSGFYKI